MVTHSSIVVVGAGYVGLATAVFLAEHGYPVTVLEKNPHVIETLQHGRLHFREALLEKKLKRLMGKKKLLLSAPAEEMYRKSQLIFIAIDSVDPATGKMRLAAFEKIAKWIGEAKRKSPATVVLKSTNVIGFAERLQGLLNKTAHGRRVHLVVNPEFLREGYAYEDTACPWRIVIGIAKRSAADDLLKVYRTTYDESVPVIMTDWKSAELIKLASNVYLSHRLAFIHEIADFARMEDLDINAVRQGIGLDSRIGFDYFTPGLGFGGSCLPKDCRLINSPELEASFEFKTALTALEINERVLDLLVERLRSKLGSLKGKKIAILGAAFKPDVDDIRSSQAVKLGVKLKKRGAKIVFFDPYLPETGELIKENLTLASSLKTALHDASAVIIGTPHKQFRSLKPARVAELVVDKCLCDYFCLLDRAIWMKEGFEFI
jgi:UDPglucose 6-dehydrogenase